MDTACGFDKNGGCDGVETQDNKAVCEVPPPPPAKKKPKKQGVRNGNVYGIRSLPQVLQAECSCFMLFGEGSKFDQIRI